MRRNWIWPVLVVVLLAVVTLVMVMVRGGYRNLGTTLTTQAAITTTTDPNAFLEAGDAVDLAEVTGAKFASLTSTGGEGKTYMVAAKQPAFEALAAAVAAAEPVEGRVANGGATLAFVFEDRHTITFDLDTGAGLIGREGKAWRAKGDLAALIEGVTTAKE